MRIGILVALALAGCTTSSPSPLPITDTGVSGIGGMTWTDHDTLVVSRFDSGERRGLARVDVPSGSIVPLPGPTSECPLVSTRPRAQPDGALALVVSIVGTCPPTTEIWLDRQGEEPHRVASLGGLPNNYERIPGTANWIYGFDSGPCAWIASVPQPLSEILPLSVVAGGDSIPVDEALGRDSCDGTLLATLPTFSPAGDLAFVASPSGREVHGTSRMDSQWNLYLAETGSTAREVLSGLRDPRALAWRPDGKGLAFSGKVGDRYGVWLLGRDGSTSLIVDDDISTVAWSPDGRRLALSRERKDPLEGADLLIVDVPAEDK